jgi:hypothetical protein
LALAPLELPLLLVELPLLLVELPLLLVELPPLEEAPLLELGGAKLD